MKLVQVVAWRIILANPQVHIWAVSFGATYMIYIVCWIVDC